MEFRSKLNMKICENCSKEHDGTYGSGRFCSSKCRYGFSTKAKRIEINEKVKKTLTKEKILFSKICESCGKTFIKTNPHSRFCNRKCSSKTSYGLKTKNDIKYIYRQLCQFKFGLSTYHNEFNFDLIKEFGLYQPKNHGNNLNGISRDHKLSIHSGYKEKINPYIISHPANCELKLHSENNHKNVQNSITLKELIRQIKIINKKYNKIQDFKIFLTDEEIFNLYKTGCLSG